LEQTLSVEHVVLNSYNLAQHRLAPVVRALGRSKSVTTLTLENC
jgi:hypothetical protein